MTVMYPRGFEAWLKARAFAEGFDAAGIAAPDAIREAGADLYAYLQAGFHGDMGWLADKADRRTGPCALWPDVRSVVMLGTNYGPMADPLAAIAKRSRAAISVYAQGRDYHDIVKGKLKAVAREFAGLSGGDVKVFVDTAPVMEKPLAQAAGLGWQGKHTNLVSRSFGSWLFLGAIFTTLDAAARRSRARPLRLLPAPASTSAPPRPFPRRYRLDARRCISYLTIEHKGPIPREFRAAMGNRIYGCDDCLAVCPWNKFAQAARETQFAAREGCGHPPLADLLALDDAAFRALFPSSPIKRIGRDRFVRNVLIAAGNSGDPALTGAVRRCLAMPRRSCAAWRCGRCAASPQWRWRPASKRGIILQNATEACLRNGIAYYDWKSASYPSPGRKAAPLFRKGRG